MTVQRRHSFGGSSSQEAVFSVKLCCLWCCFCWLRLRSFLSSWSPPSSFAVLTTPAGCTVNTLWNIFTQVKSLQDVGKAMGIWFLPVLERPERNLHQMWLEKNCQDLVCYSSERKGVLAVISQGIPTARKEKVSQQKCLLELCSSGEFS